ncbi:dolichyldiphosphatase 1-like [Acanthaster planci]|uniref:Dolichyldiphosphatase n=1 Tax=Acanthaster planci TaxID=133434 RepID=A0A8B7XX06_ACAPL|nr:dolichyldiphosphatase 1-like [Acanthaster planci]
MEAGREDHTAEGEVQWRPVSLTFVEYPEGDIIGKALAYISLAPVIILVGFATLILFRREIHTITFLCGILFNEFVNWITKHIIKEPRPARGNQEMLFSEYGMPSSHSQFMWFFAVYVVLFIYVRLGLQQHSSTSLLELVWKHCLAIGTTVLALIVSFSRVYLAYHTVRQVVCGALLGTILAVPWFAFNEVFLTPLYPRVVSLRVAEILMVRDSTLIPNVLWFEYTNARTEARTRQRKQGCGNKMS